MENYVYFMKQATYNNSSCKIQNALQKLMTLWNITNIY
jgi:hypothetical protein